MNSRPPSSAPRSSGTPNYLLRRMGALAVVLVVAYSLVRVVGSFFGAEDGIAEGQGNESSTEATLGNDVETLEEEQLSDDEAEEARIDIDCSESENDELCQSLGLDADVVVTEPDVIEAGDVETPITEPPVTEPDDEPEYTGPPTSVNPASVYIVGDSDAGTFGPYLQTLLDGTLITETELNYKVSSGLARPDFFDWPSELATKLPEVDPDIIVVTFGGNDSQGLRNLELEWVVNDPLGNETAWLEEYERRAGEVMDLLLENDRAVIWVGIPNDDNPEVTAKLALQDQAAKAAADSRPDIVFIDTWGRFSGRDGGWAEFVIDPRDGVGKDVRAADGFHLNQNGAEILAIDIAVAVQEELRARGATI